MAYARFAGQLTGVAALAHYGVRYLPAELTAAPVQLLLPDGHGRTSVGFVLVERTHRLTEPSTCQPHPLAPLARALFDACRRHHSDLRAVRGSVLECLQRRLIKPSELAAEIDRGQRRWTAALRSALRDFRTGAASAPEAELHDVAAANGLEGFLWNPDLFEPGGRFIGRPDGYDPETGVALEIDSLEHHSEGTGWERTLRRNERYEALGILVVCIAPSWLRADPDGVIEHIRKTQQAMTGRPAPDVLIRR